VSRTCNSCGQAIIVTDSDALDVGYLRDSALDFDASWQDFSTGEDRTNDVVLEGAMPEGTVITVVANDTDYDVDSYGDSVGTGYVVFSVSLNGESKNFKLEGSNSSYGDWEWDRWSLIEVSGSPRTVTVWKAV
jgi:hypothetical protein